MRKYTFLFSVCVHVSLVAAVILVPLLAPERLPTLREHAIWMAVQAAPIPPPPPPPPARGVSSPNVEPAPVPAAPLQAPDSIASEPPARATGLPAPELGIVRDGGAGVFSLGGLDGGVADGVAPPPPPPEPADPLRVGGAVRAPQKIVDVRPVYPRLALAARVEGIVVLEALIAEDGSVRDVKVVSSKPLLDAAAVDAVRQWRFTPPTLNGVPIPVLMNVTVAFRLD